MDGHRALVGSHKRVIIANDAGAAGSEGGAEVAVFSWCKPCKPEKRRGLAAADAVAAADGQLPAPGRVALKI